MWAKLRSKQRSKGFTWETLPVESYGNGPQLIHQWDDTFSQGACAARGSNPGVTAIPV